MRKYVLSNGIKINYVHRQGDISSFCIGFNAGAAVEEKDELGLAHVVEHMTFKGTMKRNEEEINNACDDVFGFHNAMTNYPYVIYYGTALSSDFEKGLEIYSDILLNPIFPIEGFKEEINIILEELKEWKDDPYQECEDELFKNAFENRRIKDLIIGTEESIAKFRLEDVKNFYQRYYTPKNCTISIVSSLDFEIAINIVKKYFESWQLKETFKLEEFYEDNKAGIYIKTRKDLKGAKILYCFPIHNLSERENKLLKIFNCKFGEGTSSILYNTIRTNEGLVYDIGSYVRDEKGIELFTIRLGTSVGNIDKAIKLINYNIEEIKNNNIFAKENIQKIIRSLNLKRELTIERSIELCKKLSIYEIMYNSTEGIFKEFDEIGNISSNEISIILKKVLVNPSIQILRPE